MKKNYSNDRKTSKLNIFSSTASVKSGLLLLSIVIIFLMGGYIILNQQAQEKKRLEEEAADKAQLIANQKKLEEEATAKAQLIANQKPKISDIFKAQLVQFIQGGGELQSMTGIGITLDKLTELTSAQKSRLEFLVMSWPENFCPEAKDLFAKSILGYVLAAQIWDKGAVRTYQDFELGEALIKYEGSNLVTLDSDSKFFPVDKNIPVLFEIAGNYFGHGRELVMHQLE